MSNHHYRRVFGLLFGAAIGLVFGLVLQGINHLFLPGIPLYHSNFGFWGNVFAAVLLGLGLGLISAWPTTSAWGIFWGSVTGALVIGLVTVFSGSRETLGLAIGSVVVIFGPVAAACGLLFIVFRWIVDREMNIRFDLKPVRRLILPLAALLVAAMAASFSLYSPLARTVTTRMNDLILEGRQANGVGGLPASLRSKNVTGFMAKAQASYELEWMEDAENQYRISRPLTDPYQPTTVVARFDNGYLLACVFPNADAPPACRDF
jgi:hypothetical protein